MKRVVRRRTIWAPGTEFEVYPHSIDLALVAHAAAVETLQVDLVVKGWVGLFDALLQPGTDKSDLIWQANGPGGEAEIKRAYSGLFGRFFGRAILRHEHKCLSLRQVRDGLAIATGIELRRKSQFALGDLPDWVGWNPHHGCFTICEAKGSHEKAKWSGRKPPILAAAHEQIDRVEIVDGFGRLQTKNWVVASRWGTASNGKEPTIITDDPLTDGRVLPQSEASRVAAEAHALWVADLVDGIGWPARADAVRRGAPTLPPGPGSDISAIAGRKCYAALAIDGRGIFPLRGPARVERFNLLKEIASETSAKIAAIGIELSAVDAAAEREWTPPDEPLSEDNGRTVISDGVVLSWDLQRVSF